MCVCVCVCVCVFQYHIYDFSAALLLNKNLQKFCDLCYLNYFLGKHMSKNWYRNFIVRLPSTKDFLYVIATYMCSQSSRVCLIM